jgi:hypothetical protein
MGGPYARDAGAGNQMLGCGGLARRQSPNVSFRKIGLWPMNLEATRRNEKRRLGALWFNGIPSRLSLSAYSRLQLD